MAETTPMERLEALDDAYDLKEVYASDDIAVQMDWLAADLRWARSEIARLTADCARKDLALNAPELHDFASGVVPGSRSSARAMGN